MSGRCDAVVCLLSDSRAVAVHLDGVDAVLGEASALQEGSVITDLHTLTGEAAAVKQLDAVMLSMLQEKREAVRKPRPPA